MKKKSTSIAPVHEYQLLENPWSQRPDVYFIIGGLLSKDSLTQFADYHLFSFAGADDLPGGTVADGIVLRHHHLHPFLIPKGVYPALTDDAILTLSVRSVLIAHQTFDEELGYNIARTLFGQSQEIAQLYPLVTMELNENAIAADLMLPLHEGTRRFLDRDRPGFIERNVEVLALYLTVLITLVTGAVAFLRHRAQARKDRVDVYYTKLIEIRDKMKTVPNDNRVIYNEVLGVQREVLDLLENDDGWVTIPLRLVGPLDAPAVRLNADALADVAKRGARREVKRRVFGGLRRRLNDN